MSLYLDPYLISVVQVWRQDMDPLVATRTIIRDTRDHRKNATYM